MIITKSGKGYDSVQKPWVGKKFKCARCGCEFTLEAKDKVTYTADQRDGDFYTVVCPECHHPMTFVK